MKFTKSDIYIYIYKEKRTLSSFTKEKKLQVNLDT